MKKNPPIMRGIPLIKGFLTGSMFSAAIVAPFGFIVQLVFLLIFFALFFDVSCAFGRERHIFSFLMLMSVGLVTGFVSVLSGGFEVFLLLVFVIMGFVYLAEYRSRVH